MSTPIPRYLWAECKSDLLFPISFWCGLLLFCWVKGTYLGDDRCRQVAIVFFFFFPHKYTIVTKANHWEDAGWNVAFGGNSRKEKIVTEVATARQGQMGRRYESIYVNCTDGKATQCPHPGFLSPETEINNAFIIGRSCQAAERA